MTETVRRRMLELLRAGPATVADLARALGLREPEAAEHLSHALRSLAPGERVVVEPARCRACGFSFRDRTRSTRPGRCPRCRAERIAPARYRVKGPGG
ncbi:MULTISPECIES: transcriptional regulator [Deferrisoma]